VRSSNGEFKLLCRPDQTLMDNEDVINPSEMATRGVRLQTKNTDFFRILSLFCRLVKPGDMIMEFDAVAEVQ